MDASKLQVVVVDDHTLFRRGLVGLLSDMPEIKVTGEAGNGREAIRVIEECQPDVVLLDVNMPEMDGVQTVQTLRQMGSRIRILMLTISQNEADLINSIRMGADGYLLKNTEPEALREAILRVVEGQGFISPELTPMVFKALVQNKDKQNQPQLSEREVDVLKHLALGLTTIQIGEKLFISENTVKTHVRNILKKLESSNRTEAVKKALELGLI